MADPFEEDADARSHLAALGPAALADLAPDLGPFIDLRTDVLRTLTARPASADLATLIAMADTDEFVRLRPLRAIRDLGIFGVTGGKTVSSYPGAKGNRRSSGGR